MFFFWRFWHSEKKNFCYLTISSIRIIVGTSALCLAAFSNTSLYKSQPFLDNDSDHPFQYVCCKLNSPISTATEIKISITSSSQSDGQSIDQIKSLLLGLVISKGFCVSLDPNSVTSISSLSSQNRLEVVETKPLDQYVHISTLTNVIIVSQNSSPEDKKFESKEVIIGGLFKPIKMLESIFAFRETH